MKIVIERRLFVVITWVLSDKKKIGTHTQCLGIAEELCPNFVFKKISPRFPWKYLPPYLWFGALQAQGDSEDPMGPPWPDVVIAGGRASAAIAAELRRCFGSFTIFVQDPYLSAAKFDWVIVREHDRLQGPNVLRILGAMHRVTPQKLLEAKEQWKGLLNGLKSPYLTVLVGGDSAHYRYQEKDIEELGAFIHHWHAQKGGSILLTVSRRTPLPLRQSLYRLLASLPHHFWDGEGENPYLGYLALADEFIVTSDSVSMISEACYTGQPVYIYELPITTKKFQDFYASLYERDYARPLTKEFISWPHRRLDEDEHILPLLRTELQKFLEKRLKK